MNIIEKLRREMKKENIDFYVIPMADPNGSEYIPEYWKGIKYISGFTGSAGTLIVEEDKAILWTDGRYFIQAEEELNEEIKLYKMGIKKYPTIKEYIRKKLKEGKKLGIYGKLINSFEFKSWIDDIDSEYELNIDLLDRIWSDRPEYIPKELFIIDEKYTGECTKSKIKRLRQYMKEKDEDIHIVSALDEIAYLYNLRGKDIKNNPVFISYTIISNDEAILYTNAIIRKEIENYAKIENFKIKSIDDFEKDIKSINNKKIGIDPRKTNIWIEDKLKNNIVKYNEEIITKFESIRNDVQIDNMKRSQIEDGIAVIKTLNYIYKNIDKNISEIDISEKLIEYRKKSKSFLEPSFDTIAAYKEHGAMMHYKADRKSNYYLKKEGLLLIDSGGHYLTGTTDITRTISLGTPTKEEIRDYTLTLKGMISLTRTKFLMGTLGSSLDIIARRNLWKEGIDYKCGTGHGVGYILSVHLGEQRISPYANKSYLEQGMVITNEPGVYKEGKYGIRIENMLLVKKSEISDEENFLEFETLTLCPFDKKLIDFTLLNSEEIEFIEGYHNKIRNELGRYLDDEEKDLIWNIKDLD